MNKKVLVTVIVGLCLFIIGGVLAGVGYARGGVDEFKTKDMANMRIISEKDIIKENSEDLPDFSGLDIKGDYGYIEVVKGDSFNVKFNNYITETMPSYKVEDGILTITYQEHSNWFGLNFDATAAAVKNGMVITVPQDAELAEAKVTSEGGGVKIADNTFTSLYIDSGYDTTNLTNVTCENLTYVGDWSKLELTSVKSQKAEISGIDDFEAQDIEGGAWSLEAEDGGSGFSLENAKLDSMNITGYYTLNLQNNNITTLAVNSSYGDVNIDGLNGDKLEITSSDGQVDVNKAVVGSASIKSDYGPVIMSESETKALKITAADSDIDLMGNFLGTSEIDTDYGNITMVITGAEKDYGYSLKTEYGTSEVNNETIDGALIVRSDTDNQINCNTSDGNITLNFQA